MSLFIAAIALFFFWDSASADSKPGGIVYKENREILYYDFFTKKTTNLLDGLKGAFCDGQFAISDNGAILIWVQQGKCFKRDLPKGEAHEVLGDFSAKRKLAISSQGVHNTNNVKISFEYAKPGMAWTEVPRDSDMFMLWVREGSGRAPYANWPMYVKMPDTCRAIQVSDLMALNNRVSDAIACGNVAEFPPTMQFKTNYESYGTRQEPPVSMTIKPRMILSPLEKQISYGPLGILTLTMEDAFLRFSIKREAFFGCWSKNPVNDDNQFFACIYKTPFGWGPIEIRGKCEASGLGHLRGADFKKKPGIYEIEMLTKAECKGLSWKPDGSITILVGKKLFCFDGESIRKGMENSGTANHPDKKIKSHLPIGTVFSIKPELVADEIDGDSVWWVSDNAFIFRGSDGGLYHWKNKETKLVRESVPLEFFHCNPYSDDPNAQTLVTTADTEKKEGCVPLGNDSCSIKMNEETVLRLSGISVVWTAEKNPRAQGGYDYYIKVLNLDTQSNFEYSLLKPGDLAPSSMKDPTVYKYEKEFPGQKRRSLKGFLKIEPMQTVIARVDNYRSAIQMTWRKTEKARNAAGFAETDEMQFDIKSWKDVTSNAQTASKISPEKKTTK